MKIVLSEPLVYLSPTTALERQNLIQKIAQLPDQVAELVAPLSPAQLVARPLMPEWSVAQNVHHLVDSHMNSYVRCKLIATEQKPPLKPYDQDAWAALPDASDADISMSLSMLKGLHGRWVHFWRTLSDEAWARTGLHAQYGEMSLERILNSYVEHGEGHIQQMKRTMAAL